MSAPLVVNTSDGTCWTRREATRDGLALYTPEKCPGCPEFVMATYGELDEHGIAGEAYALPVPGGPELQEREAVKAQVRAKVEAAKAMPARERIYHMLCATHTHAEAEAMLAEVAGVDSRRLIRAEQRRAELEAVLGAHRKDDQAEIERLQKQVAELLAERHVTNEALDDAVQELARREDAEAPLTVFRAEHPDSGITLGHYGAEAAARAHCEATERRSWPTGTNLAFDWIEDDEDRVAELVVTAGQNEESTTGYIVTALELASEYDEEADE